MYETKPFCMKVQTLRFASVKHITKDRRSDSAGMCGMYAELMCASRPRAQLDASETT